MINKIILGLILAYKKHLSPLFVAFFGNACRFSPTCSEYSFQAIEKYGVIKGTMKSFARVSRCHPLSRPGYDPLT